MTIASDIFHESNRIIQAEVKASRLAVEIDQKWDLETTLYFFSDESVLSISGPSLNHYPSIRCWEDAEFYAWTERE